MAETAPRWPVLWDVRLLNFWMQVHRWSLGRRIGCLGSGRPGGITQTGISGCLLHQLLRFMVSMRRLFSAVTALLSCSPGLPEMQHPLV
tara:strand:- start:684 stop:950 length:267 start_codon:yes stop_codon:yes gene_type:complete